MREQLYEEAYRELLEEGYRIEDIYNLARYRVEELMRMMQADLEDGYMDKEEYYE